MKILVVRYGTVGDSILTSSFIRELRNFYIDAQIDVLADKISKGVFEYCPYIDNIVEIEDKHKSFLKKYPQLFKISKEFKGYDKIYYTRPEEHFISIAAKIAGIPERVGYLHQRNKYLTNGCEYDENIHVVDSLMNVLKSDGVTVNNSKPEIWLNSVYEAKIKHLLKELNPENKKIVVVHASTRVWQKNWLDEYWAQVLDYLVKRDDSIILLSGAQKDIPAYRKILKLLNFDYNGKIINTAGCFNIQESMAVIKYSDLFVGLDSGLVHAAAALDKPSVMIHGSSPLIQYRPLNKNLQVVSLNYPCSPCIMNLKSKGIGCKNEIPRCFANLKPEMVISEIDKFLTAKL